MFASSGPLEDDGFGDKLSNKTLNIILYGKDSPYVDWPLSESVLNDMLHEAFSMKEPDDICFMCRKGIYHTLCLRHSTKTVNTELAPEETISIETAVSSECAEESTEEVAQHSISDSNGHLTPQSSCSFDHSLLSPTSKDGLPSPVPSTPVKNPLVPSLHDSTTECRRNLQLDLNLVTSTPKP